jgi:integrase
MQPEDAGACFGRVLRDARPSTRTGRAAALTVYFQFLELRRKAEIYNLSGRVAECPLDEMNRPRASVDPQLRIPPTGAEVEWLFAGWREELATCRKFAPAARNYAVARLEADVGLRVNEVRMLDLDDVRWELGRFGKLNVRHGKGSRRKGPKPRLVPLINGADRNLLWFIEDVWGHFGDDHERPGVGLGDRCGQRPGTWSLAVGRVVIKGRVEHAHGGSSVGWGAGLASQHRDRHPRGTHLSHGSRPYGAEPPAGPPPAPPRPTRCGNGPNRPACRRARRPAGRRRRGPVLRQDRRA